MLREEFAVYCLRAFFSVEGVDFSLYKVGKEMGVDHKTVKSWLEGKTNPSRAHRQLIWNFIIDNLPE